MAFLRLAVCLLAVSPMMAAGQTDPPGRFLAASAYDQFRHRLVVFGGLGPEDGPLGDTWEWDGTAWKQVQSDSSPSPRAGHAMVFDPVRNVVLLFGGADSDVLNDLWSFDGTSWRKLASVEGPTPRAGALMVWNPDRRTVLLVGGQSESGRAGALWEWNGARWTLLSGSDAPSEAELAKMEHWRGAAYQASVKTDLRNLVTAQEVFFADNNRYAKTLVELGDLYQASDSVTIELVNATTEAYGAVGTRAGWAEGRCVIYIGARPDSFPQDLPEGSPGCTGFQPPQ